MKIVEKGGLKDCCRIIHEYLLENINKIESNIIQLGCDAASSLILRNE
jgi:hypothetical protein